MARFQNNFTEMFFRWPATKIVKMVPLHWTKWPPKLKIEKKNFKHLLLGQRPNFRIIYYFTEMILGWCSQVTGKRYQRPWPLVRDETIHLKFMCTAVHWSGFGSWYFFLNFSSVIFNQTATYFPLNSLCWNIKKDQPLMKYGQTLASYWVVRSRAVAKYLPLNIQIGREHCQSIWGRDFYYQTSRAWSWVTVILLER